MKTVDAHNFVMVTNKNSNKTNNSKKKKKNIYIYIVGPSKQGSLI